MNLNEEKILEYNRIDVLSLYSLTQKFRNTILELTKDDVMNYNTIGQHAFDLCAKSWEVK